MQLTNIPHHVNGVRKIHMTIHLVVKVASRHESFRIRKAHNLEVVGLNPTPSVRAAPIQHATA